MVRREWIELIRAWPPQIRSQCAFVALSDHGHREGSPSGSMFSCHDPGGRTRPETGAHALHVDVSRSPISDGCCKLRDVTDPFQSLPATRPSLEPGSWGQEITHQGPI